MSYYHKPTPENIKKVRHIINQNIKAFNRIQMTTMDKGTVDSTPAIAALLV